MNLQQYNVEDRLAIEHELVIMLIKHNCNEITTLDASTKDLESDNTSMTCMIDAKKTTP